MKEIVQKKHKRQLIHMIWGWDKCHEEKCIAKRVRVTERREWALILLFFFLKKKI